MSFADKLKKFTNDAVEKGKGLAEQGKLSLDNQKQQDVIKRAQQYIGAYVAENNLLAEDEFVMSQLSAIAAANEIIEKNNTRIADLKAAGAAEEPGCEAPEAYTEAAPEAPFEAAAEAAAEAATEAAADTCDCVKETVQRAFCPACGKEVEVGTRFCPACGKQLL